MDGNDGILMFLFFSGFFGGLCFGDKKSWVIQFIFQQFIDFLRYGFFWFIDFDGIKVFIIMQKIIKGVINVSVFEFFRSGCIGYQKDRVMEVWKFRFG